MGLGALWDPNEHPRGWHGRFVKKFKLAPWLDKVLKDFSPRQFQSNNQAAQYAFNQGHKSPGGAFTPEALKRVHLDWDEAQDALRAGKIDPTTQKFVDAMSTHMQPAPEGLILSKTFTPDALGLRPENLNTNPDDPNSILHQIGNTITDKGFSATHLGTNDSHGPGKITMTIAASPGTKVAFSGASRSDRGVFMDREQKLLVTHVDPDGQGGWYMMAVAEPAGATSGSPQTLVPGRKGAGLSEVQREARVGGPSATAQNVAEPPSAPARQANISPTTSVEPGQAPAPTAAKKAAKATRQAGYQKAAANEAAQAGQAPPAAPQPVTPTPAPAPPGNVGVRTEPVHQPIGGTPTEGRSASEIAGTPSQPNAPTPTPAPAPVNNGATFKQEFRDRGLQSPSAGPQRKEFNNAYLGVTGGKKEPGDALRELDADIEHNKGLLKDMGSNDPKAAELKTNIQRQSELADLIAQHFNEPRTHKTPEAAPAAVTEATKAAKAAPAPSGSKLSGSQTERNAAAAARRAETGAEKPTVNGANIKEGDKLLAVQRPDGSWHLVHHSANKTGATPVTVKSVKAGANKLPGSTRSSGQPRDIKATTADGKEVDITAGGRLAYHRASPAKAAKAAKAVTPEAAPAPEKKAGGFATVKNLSPEERKAYDALSKEGKSNYLARRRAGQSHEKALGTEAAKAAPAKATAVKAAKAAAPAAPKAVSEVQTRADAAGLPKTVTGLRAAAKEKGIRGFSTMNKEQLQRALLGEEVPKVEKALVSPEKLGPHIQAAKTENDAKALMADHTLADLRNLAKANGVDLKGKRTKPQVQDAILRHLRGEETTGIKPVKVTESLDSELKKASVVAPDGPEGEGIRKALSEVDQNDPESLRKERDALEKEAARLRAAGDRPAAHLAQGAADVLGMRAQRISGVEEAAPAKKVVKAAPPAGHEDLGGTKADLLKIAAGEGAPHKQAMTKPQLIKAITDHRAGKEPAPSPAKMAAAKKAAAPAGELHLGESRGRTGQLQGRQSPLEKVGGPQPGERGAVGPREPTPTEKFLATPPKERVLPGVQNYAGPPVGSPERERNLKALAEGRLGRGTLMQGPDVREVARLRAQEIAPKSVLAKPEKAGVPSIEELRNLGSREQFDARTKDMTSAELKQHAKELSVPRYHNMSKENLRQHIYEATTGNTLESKTLMGKPKLSEVPRKALTKEEIAALTPTHPAPTGRSPEEIKAALDKATTMEEGRAVLQGLTVAELKKIDPDAGRVTTRKADLVDAIVAKGKNQRTVGQMAKGMFSEKLANVKAAEAHPEAPPAVIKATRAKVAKAVPDGSVGTRGAEPIDNKPRATEFDQAWSKAGIPNAPDKTSQKSIDEIRSDVSSGKITPEEGIRRMESEISLNQNEIDDINRTIRSGQVSGAELDKLRTQRDRLITSKSAQESASKFMHGHFGKERVTVPEVQNSIIEAKGQGWWDNLNKEDPEAFRQEIEAGTGFKLKGSNAQEIFQDALKQTIQKGLSERAAAKAERTARKAEIADAKAKAIAEFSPGGAKHLDAKAIAGDLNVSEGDLGLVQADLNEGMSPAKAAERLRFRANRMADSNAIRHGWHSTGTSDVAQAAQKEDFRKGQEVVDNLRALADKLGQAKRPRVARKATAAQAAEDLAQARQETKSPAVRKQLAQAEQAVKNAGNEAEGLKQRILARHQTAWNEATTEEKAKAATDAMRQDLTLAEIRDWAKPQGITGRSKQDILDKAIARRFGQGGPPEVSGPAVNDRMARASQARAVARALADVEEVKANKGSKLAVSTRAKGMARAGGLPEPLVNRIHDAATSDNQTELNKIAQEHGLTKMADSAGEVVPYNPRIHDEIGTPGVREGQPVRVISPGYEGVADGRKFTAVKARVQHEPAAKAQATAAAERLRRTPAKKAAQPTAGEGAAVLAKGGFNEPFISAEVSPPRNRDAALARERAAAAEVKKAPHSFRISPDAAKTLGRENGDQTLKVPNGGADQGRIHLDSQIGGLWQDLAHDPRAQNSTLNKITDIGNDLGTGKIDVATARERLRALDPGNSALKDRVDQAIKAMEVPKMSLDLPSNTPTQVRDVLEKLNGVPAYHVKQDGKTPIERLVDAVRTISKGDRNDPNYREAERTIEHAAGRVHESGDGVYQAQRDASELSAIKQGPDVRKWLRGGVTQAEIKSPVPKVGNEAPSAPSSVTTKGLVEGEGIPISNRLALENKLSNRNTLNALDRAVRHEGTRGKVPELFQTLMTQLSQAGVGPNDEPRKSLIAWYNKHFG
jgi:hypothetical protein